MIEQIVFPVDPGKVAGRRVLISRPGLRRAVLIKVIPYHRLVDIVLKDFRRLQGKPALYGGSKSHVADSLLRIVSPVLNAVAWRGIRISLKVHPSGHHPAVRAKAEILSVHSGDPVIASLIGILRRIFLSIAAEIVPVHSVHALFAVEVVSVLVRRRQVFPSAPSGSVRSQPVHSVFRPFGLHPALRIEQVLIALHRLPFVYSLFPAALKIVPVKLPVPSVGILRLEPLLGQHNSIAVNIIIVAVDPGAYRHLAVGIQPAPEVIGSPFPFVPHAVPVPVQINPGIGLRTGPAFRRVGVYHHTERQHSRCRRDRKPFSPHKIHLLKPVCRLFARPYYAFVYFTSKFPNIQQKESFNSLTI